VGLNDEETVAMFTGNPVENSLGRAGTYDEPRVTSLLPAELARYFFHSSSVRLTAQRRRMAEMLMRAKNDHVISGGASMKSHKKKLKTR
jgi:hypothetical protein